MTFTLPIERTVLVVVHTVTSVNRLADILPVFESDSRVQLVFTAIGASAVSSGVVEALAGAGAAVIAWDQVVRTTFDLAIAVNHSGELWRIDAPLAVLSHGIGYTKYAAATRHLSPPESLKAREHGSTGARELGMACRPSGCFMTGNPSPTLSSSHTTNR